MFIILSINKHLLIGPDAYQLPVIILHIAWFADVMLQSIRHEIILHGLREVTSERQVILHDPSVTSEVLTVKSVENCIKYINYIIKQLLTYVSVDMEYY